MLLSPATMKLLLKEIPQGRDQPWQVQVRDLFFYYKLKRKREGREEIPGSSKKQPIPVAEMPTACDSRYKTWPSTPVSQNNRGYIQEPLLRKVGSKCAIIPKLKQPSPAMSCIINIHKKRSLEASQATNELDLTVMSN